jgi:flavin reductase (DIM6/NTAB) family NADH-FMN oxidoreductase RutF
MVETVPSRGSGKNLEQDAMAYQWPRPGDLDNPAWRSDPQDLFLRRRLPETDSEIDHDSRWPAFFPSPICLVTSQGKQGPVLEKVVGATIVNRFPYILAVSLCRQSLSARHYPRRALSEALELSGHATVQFLVPGAKLDAAMSVINDVPENRAHERLADSGLAYGPCENGASPILQDAYLAYEGCLTTPRQDATGDDIFPEPYRDIGSHRLYFLEIRAIYLRRDIACGEKQIRWRSLPLWPDRPAVNGLSQARMPVHLKDRYSKSYTPDYRFPAPETVAFEYDRMISNWAFKQLPNDPVSQVEIENDRARWPCFFPSSLGMISTWANANQPNVMPCGSTAVVARQPLVIAVAICYAPINDRYAPRATLDAIQENGRFACGVGYDDPLIVDAVGVAGNISLTDLPDKVAAAGLEIWEDSRAPVLTSFPITFQCKVVGEQRLGTHVMVFGAVSEIFVRQDLEPAAPLHWGPWGEIITHTKAR